VDDCCLTPNDNIFQLYHGENRLNSIEWWRCPFCSRPTRWVGILQR